MYHSGPVATVTLHILAKLSRAFLCLSLTVGYMHSHSWMRLSKQPRPGSLQLLLTKGLRERLIVCGRPIRQQTYAKLVLLVLKLKRAFWHVKLKPQAKA